MYFYESLNNFTVIRLSSIIDHYIIHFIGMNTVAEEIVCGAKPVLRLVALVSVLIQIEIGATNGEEKVPATTHARKYYAKGTCQPIF